jgi:hypothetical protein
MSGDRAARGKPTAEAKPTTLVALGITANQSSRWQKLAAIDEVRFEQAVAAAREVAGEVTTAAMLRLEQPHVTQNSGDNEWYTPAPYIEAARKVLGKIFTDPASSEKANRIVRATRYFTAVDNGLAHIWDGPVWMNPPYAQPLITRFAAAFAEKSRSEFGAGIALVNNATETEWFQAILAVSTGICFPRSRIRFLKDNGEVGAPLQGQAVLYVGSQSEKFCAEFQAFGYVARLTP